MKHSTISRIDKIFKTANRVVEKGVICLFALVMLIGLYMILDTIHVYNSASNDIERYKPDVINGETLREISGDAVAWLEIYDTSIDYPVMQTKNNVEYLNRDAKGNYSLGGSIFMDSRCDPEFRDQYSLIYGHHMVNGLMFGALDKFEDGEYFKEHREGVIITKTRTIPFKTVAYLISKANVDEIFNPELNIDYDEFYRENAKYYKPDDMTDHIVALTTCKDPATIERAALIIALEE